MNKKKSKFMMEIKRKDDGIRSATVAEQLGTAVDGNTQEDLDMIVSSIYDNLGVEQSEVKIFRRSFLWWRRLLNLNYSGVILYVDYDSNRMKQLAGL